jgi:hypothetical protein
MRHFIGGIPPSVGVSFPPPNFEPVSSENFLLNSPQQDNENAAHGQDKYQTFPWFCARRGITLSLLAGICQLAFALTNGFWVKHDVVLARLYK